jgi:sec-independent protein translocase protein TatB
MLDVGWSELLVIGIVALIFIGPKELPTVLRTVGQWMGKIRRMASEFQGQFQEAMREAEMEDLKKHVDSMTQNFDPLESVRKEVEAATAIDDKPQTAAPPEPGSQSSDAVATTNTQATPAQTPASTDAVEAPVAPSEPTEPSKAVSEVKEAGERAA